MRIEREEEDLYKQLEKLEKKLKGLLRKPRKHRAEIADLRQQIRNLNDDLVALD